MIDAWSGPAPVSNQFPHNEPNGIRKLLDRIVAVELQVKESTSNLLRTAGIKLTPAGMVMSGVPVYASNTAAIAGGLAVGALYRNGADPDHLCIVH